MHEQPSIRPRAALTRAEVRRRLTALAVLAAFVAPVAFAATPADLLAGYEQAARSAASAFAGFSAERGRRFFVETHGTDWSCATCHTGNPAAAGKHATTGKSIAPLAPAAAPNRFADEAKAEKWFKRNCNDVLGRECTPVEKGDVLTFLLSVRQ